MFGQKREREFANAIRRELESAPIYRYDERCPKCGAYHHTIRYLDVGGNQHIAVRCKTCQYLWRRKTLDAPARDGRDRPELQPLG